MVSGVDVKFLSSIVNGMNRNSLNFYKRSVIRSNAAVILRFGDEDARRVSKMFTPHDLRQIGVEGTIQRLQESMILDADSSLQVLFIKRADIDGDRWSGAVAFPGGKRDMDDPDDKTSLERTTFQQIGIPLQSDEFVCLGRLPDFLLHSRVVTKESGVQSRFVYLHVGDMTPTTVVSTFEVEGVQWYPLSRLTKRYTDRDKISFNIVSFFRAQSISQQQLIGDIFRGTRLFFPSVSMPQRWNIWGHPLRTISELMRMEGRPPIDWPFVTTNNRILQFFVFDAAHGYIEVIQNYRYKKSLEFLKKEASDKGQLRKLPWRDEDPHSLYPYPYTPRHIFALAVSSSILAMCCYYFIVLIWSVFEGRRQWKQLKSESNDDIKNYFGEGNPALSQFNQGKN